MASRDFELADKGLEVVKAVGTLKDEIHELASIDNIPHVDSDDVETIFTAFIKFVASILKH